MYRIGGQNQNTENLTDSMKIKNERFLATRQNLKLVSMHYLSLVQLIVFNMPFNW